VGIRTNRVELLDEVIPRLPPGWKPSASSTVDLLFSLRGGGETGRKGVRAFHLLYLGAGRLARTHDLDALFEIFESELHHLVAAFAPARLFLHAGVVGWRGRAIVLPGSSFAGKSTLVTALVRAGATYYSDEYAVLDTKGRVHPFARPLSLREPEGVRRCGVEELGGRAGTTPHPVGLVALTEYRPGRQWRPTRLSPGQACLGLLAQTVPARRRAGEAIAQFRALTETVPVLRGSRGEADEAAAALLSRCRW
jgi:hypothetical protein